jgi:hypothetical protein
MKKHFFFKKFIMGIKNAEFAADFGSVKKKLLKTCKKITNEKAPKMEFLTACKTFRPIYFLAKLFALFAMDSSSASNFAWYEPISHLKKNCFAYISNFCYSKAKIVQKRLKKTKKYFKNVS